MIASKLNQILEVAASRWKKPLDKVASSSEATMIKKLQELVDDDEKSWIGIIAAIMSKSKMDYFYRNPADNIQFDANDLTVTFIITPTYPSSGLTGSLHIDIMKEFQPTMREQARFKWTSDNVWTSAFRSNKEVMTDADIINLINKQYAIT